MAITNKIPMTIPRFFFNVLSLNKISKNFMKILIHWYILKLEKLSIT